VGHICMTRMTDERVMAACDSALKEK